MLCDIPKTQKMIYSPLQYAMVAYFVVLTGGHAWILSYMLKLIRDTDCLCAQTWEQKCMTAFSVITIAIGLCYVFFFASGQYSCISHSQYHVYFSALYGILGVSYFIVSILFVRRVKHDKCDCGAEDSVSVLTFLEIMKGWVVSMGWALVVFIILTMFILYKVLNR